MVGRQRPAHYQEHCSDILKGCVLCMIVFVPGEDGFSYRVMRNVAPKRS